jgi:hypothetical protein
MARPPEDTAPTPDTIQGPTNARELWHVNPQQALLVEAESLLKFRTRVDAVLTKLLGTEAAPTSLGTYELTRKELGGGGAGFHEAAALFTSYETVITQLKTLSGMLSDSIEGLSIAVTSSSKGYENLDDDVKDRMNGLHRSTTEWAETHEKPGDAGAGSSAGGQDVGETGVI